MLVGCRMELQEEIVEGSFRELPQVQTKGETFELAEYRPEREIIRLPLPAELPQAPEFPDWLNFPAAEPEPLPTMNSRLNAAYSARDPHKHTYQPSVGEIVDEYARGKPSQPRYEQEASQGFDFFAGLDSVLSSIGSIFEGLSNVFLFDWLFGSSTVDVAPKSFVAPTHKPGPPMRLVYFRVSHDLGTTVRDALENKGLSIHPMGYTNTEDGQLYQFRFGVPIKLAGWCIKLLEEMNVDWESEK